MQDIIKSVKEVYSDWRYSVFSAFVFLFFLLLAILLPRLSVLRNAFFSEVLTARAKWAVLADTLLSACVGHSLWQEILIVFLVLLITVNITLLVYYVKKRITLQRSAGAGVIGTFIGVLGLGCGACGAVLLSSLLGVGASASVLGFLPLRGTEFLILGIILVGFSVYKASQKIQEPNTCQVVSLESDHSS